jgi:hypothetical protein
LGAVAVGDGIDRKNPKGKKIAAAGTPSLTNHTSKEGKVAASANIWQRETTAQRRLHARGLPGRNFDGEDYPYSGYPDP